jgi:phosphoesterase RecJ-like protein
VWAAFQRFLEAHDVFILTTHRQPDGDGIAASCAMQELLRQLNKSARIVLEDEAPSNLSFLAPNATMREDALKMSDATALLVLDAHQPERIGQLAADAEERAWGVACIDHHPQRSQWGDVHLIDARAAAVGLLVAQLFEMYGISLTRRAADAIYTSIYSDTGGFAHGCEGPEVFDVVSRCVAAGASPESIRRFLTDAYEMDELIIYADIVRASELYMDGECLVQIIDFECHSRLLALRGEEVDLSALHALNKQVKGVRCTAILLESDLGRVRLSVRGVAGMDLGKAMQVLGGGGHARAAGASIEGSIDDARLALLSAVAPQLEPA